jgi:putative heme-binding domain-containing protein
MNRRFSWKFIVNAGPILGLLFTLAVHAQSLPEGPGRAPLQRICSSCHTVNVATSQHLSHAGWQNVVADMVSRGAQGTQDEFDEIVSYLSKNFGAGSPTLNASQGRASAPAPVRMPPAPQLDPSQIAHAKEIVNANGCLSCHRIDGNGSYVGPDLEDVGAHRTADQIRAALVSPSQELPPEDRTVRLVTQDGNTVTGRLLNQDGFSVQLIDASGHLMSFERTNLREFTIVTTNPMPSYANKIADRDLSVVVQYLQSMQGAGQTE